MEEHNYNSFIRSWPGIIISPKRLRYPQQSQKEEVVRCQNSFHNFNIHIHKSMLLDTGNQSSVQKKKSILIEADGGFTVKLSERWQLLHQRLRGNLGNKSISATKSNHSRRRTTGIRRFQLWPPYFNMDPLSGYFRGNSYVETHMATPDLKSNKKY